MAAKAGTAYVDFQADLTALKESELWELGEVAVRALGDYGPTFRAMLLFAGYVGLRPGELFALERGDLRKPITRKLQELRHLWPPIKPVQHNPPPCDCTGAG